MISLRKLAERCHLSVNTTNRAVKEFDRRGLIRYRPGQNQFHPTIFEIPTGAGAELSQSESAVPKNGVAIPSDKYNITNDLSIGDIYDREVVHNQEEDSDCSEEQKLAHQVADGLSDTKNLGLYQSYCRRYPAEIILTAYVRAKEVSPDKIKKSRGALFNFLVQKYGGKNKHNRNYPGPASGSAGDGNSRARRR